MAALRTPLWLAFVCWSVCSVLAACSSAPRPQTQATVVVAADERLGPKLKALKVLLYAANASDEASPSRVHVFDLSGALKSSKALPLSFGVTRGRADVFLLAVLGCGDGNRCRDVLVAHKSLVRFRPDHTVQVDVVLTSACESVGTCDELLLTCAPWDGEDAGTCVPVREAETRTVRPGDEIIPVVPAPAERDVPDAEADEGSEEHLDGGGDAELDMDAASDPHAQPVDAQGEDVSEAPICGATNTCSDEYPCTPTEGAGYVCRGQFADWEMPDSLPDARVAPRYELVSTNVVKDAVTGLSWQRQLPGAYPGCSGSKTSPDDSCSWEEAKAYCAQLTLDGLQWRLPTKIELESLLELRPNHNLDPAYFFVTPYESHWTGSTHPNPQRDSMAYAINFATGHSTVEYKRESYMVRCVHSRDTLLPEISERFVQRSNEQLIGDRRTQLQWSIFLACAPDFSFSLAEDTCAELPGGMRLPSLKELLTLVDPTRFAPAIAEPFSYAGAPEQWYWSSTPSFDSSPWLVGYSLGVSVTGAQFPLFNPPDGAPATKCVRCVR